MSFRLTFAAAAALTLVGCNAGGSDTDAADASGIADGDALDQFAYAAGFQQGTQYLAGDSSFSFDRFRDGFNAGLRGDSAEVAYAAGLQLGFDLAQDSLGVVNREMLLAGVRAALEQQDNAVSDERFAEVQEIFGDSLFVRQLRADAANDPTAAERLAQVSSNATASEAFIREASARDGVTQTAEGVYSLTTSPGDGPSPTATDRVRINYTGQLPDGTIFDQSGENGAELGVGQVVPGFREALLDMNVGETRTVFIAPDQAYGLRGQQGPGGQGGIAPNQALQFEITLLEILAPQARPAGPQFQIPGQ